MCMNNIKYYNVLISTNIRNLYVNTIEFRVIDENEKNMLENICLKNNYEILIRKAQR